MGLINRATYLSTMQEVSSEIEEKINSLQEFSEETQLALEDILKKYNDDWKYAGDAIVDPSVQPWAATISDDELESFNDAYESVLDTYDELRLLGSKLEKAIDKVRDAKRLTEKV